jgi:hypothetical protein
VAAKQGQAQQAQGVGAGGATAGGVKQQQLERVAVQQQKLQQRERMEKIPNVRELGKQEAPLGSNRAVYQQQGLLARASRLALR